MHIDLSGRVAVVTGAGRGIGRVIAETFADEGMMVVGTDVRDDLLDSLAGDGPEGRRALTPHKCDVRDASAVARLVDDVLGRFGRVDVLVNNAGVGFGASPVESTTEEAWDASLGVNLKGTFLTCRAFAPVMKAQRSGRILNAASFAAVVPSVGGAAYAASKAGVYSLTRVLAGELGPYDVTVNCYAPGMIPTELNHFADMPPERKERLLDTLTVRRWGDPRDVAHLLCFLASDHAGYITGTMIDVSGGKFATQIPRAGYEHAAAAGDYAWQD